MKPTITEMRDAMRDLKFAFSASAIGDNGNFCCYEINGTAKVIPIAVAALLKIRKDGQEDDA